MLSFDCLVVFIAKYLLLNVYPSPRTPQMLDRIFSFSTALFVISANLVLVPITPAIAKPKYSIISDTSTVMKEYRSEACWGLKQSIDHNARINKTPSRAQNWSCIAREDGVRTQVLKWTDGRITERTSNAQNGFSARQER
jgi:hypothetical protein